MKVKEVSRTANVAWSPREMQAIHLACGTVAQQLDATFRYGVCVWLFLVGENKLKRRCKSLGSNI